MRLAFSRALAPLLLVALASALPVAAAGGCGRSACFAYSQEAYAKNGMACPAQKDALPNFTDPSCPGPVTSVDGEGSFDGELCCYPVTEEDITPNCGNGMGGAASPPSSGFGGGFSEGAVSAVGVSASSGGSCAASSCAVAVTNGGAPCFGGKTQYDALQSCAGCSGVSGACASQCGNFCADGPIEPQCLTCLEGICQKKLTACENN